MKKILINFNILYVRLFEKNRFFHIIFFQIGTNLKNNVQDRVFYATILVLIYHIYKSKNILREYLNYCSSYGRFKVFFIISSSRVRKMVCLENSQLI